MTPEERRGRRLFLLLAGFIVLEKLTGVALALSGGLAEVNWIRSVAQPLALALAVVFLWNGDEWLRRLVGVACVLTGGMSAYVSVRVLIKLARVTPPKATAFLMDLAGYPLGMMALFGVLYLTAGLLFLFSPSMGAFFRYRRERGRGWIAEG
jgi:hypothetical protein